MHASVRGCVRSVYVRERVRVRGVCVCVCVSVCAEGDFGMWVFLGV